MLFKGVFKKNFLVFSNFKKKNLALEDFTGGNWAPELIFWGKNYYSRVF